MSSSLLDAARDRSTRYHKSVSESTRRSSSSSRGRRSSSGRRSSHRQSSQRNGGSDDEESGHNLNSVRTGVSRVSSHSTTSGVDNNNNNNNRREATEDYQLEEDNVNHSDDDDKTVDTKTGRATHPEAHYKQNYAPFSTTFCIIQCIILPLMMWQCGIAPMNINPMIGPYPDALNYWGAKNAVLIIEDGEWWRLFTPIFLHAGLIHLVGNVMVQIDAGNTWEKEWGSLVWMIVYVGGAFGSSVFSTCFMPGNISVGSSGAVMALFGAKFSEIVLLCCEKSTNLKELAGERSRKRQACLVIGGIIIVSAMSFIPYVDWAAHLGGIIAGFVLGLVCFSFKIRSWPFMLLWLVVGFGSCIALYSGLIAYMYNDVETNDELRDVCGYYKEYFDDYECNCMLDEAYEFGSWSFGGNNNNNGEGGGENNK